MDTHEVAMMVFATVPGVDAGDAANRFGAALQCRMLWNGDGLYIPESPRGAVGGYILVHQVIEAGAAISNGYMRSFVTDKARRESPHPQKGDH